MNDKEILKEKKINFIEKCIGIMGNKAYQGSYAAPREAFRYLIEQVRVDERQKIREMVEGMRKTEQDKPCNHQNKNGVVCSESGMKLLVLDDIINNLK